ncbi:sialate O-acetylesterase [Siphonobacter sp. SORGH_AS_1065]|uniref:sialate O-acetylesterase n=1 Tax=Siphonobacter sp. SORGH_AS_1065 TaxID=3041795 RepID=UPI002787FDEC|nr:sialate O-acetylesterase [Siphonobacter sp. SORGH_AS_1065]MDQ1089347.1 hypothetical protein [Siphonobacter sp. SORGH_AS_1065]
MKLNYTFFIGCLYLLFSSSAFAQVNITFPVKRIVFQRNASNNASVTVSGNYANNADKIEARFVARNGQGTSTNWTPIAAGSGVFQGTVQVSGGWYDVEVRSSAGGNVLSSSKVERVGVGEVFVIAGQSNAQGRKDQTDIPEPQDDRINVITNFTENENSSQEPGNSFPEFNKMTASIKYAPYGYTAWHWGHLGDLLAQQYNVPILFINAAFSATGAYNWEESSKGLITKHPYADYNLPQGMPYANLRLSLQYYGNLTGIRGVLWLQGEWDGLNNTNPETYYNQVKTVIEKSRADFGGKSLSWMIARVSLYIGANNATFTSSNVIQGQNLVAERVSNCFKGPETDNIQNPRDPADPGHFYGSANHKKHGQAWFDAINSTNFLGASQPQTAASMLQTAFACAGSSQFSLTLQSATGQGLWVNASNGSTQSGQSITGQAGVTYYARSKDGVGNSSFAPPFTVPSGIGTPSISATSLAFCPGGSTTLTANGAGTNFVWSNGQTGKSITVKEAGSYTVKIKDAGGCESGNSAPVEVKLSSALAAPEITASTSVVCEGSSVVLSVPANSSYQWSTGATTQSITVNAAGSYTVKVKDAFGCESSVSKEYKLTTSPLPAAPTLTASGSVTNLCPGTQVTLSSSAGSSYKWSNNSTAQTLVVTQPGRYTAQVTNANGCVSPVSAAIEVTYTSKPNTPVITASGKLDICEGETIKLSSSKADNYFWSDNSNTQELTVSKSGEFNVYSTNASGCKSDLSNTVRVTVHALPAKPSVVAQGPSTVCDGVAVNLNSSVQAATYSWSTGETSPSINTTKAGDYTVLVKDQYGCTSPVSDALKVIVRSLPATPTIAASGPVTNFCPENPVTLTSTSSQKYTWNNGSADQSIKVSQEGSFTVKVTDEFGCTSLPSAVVQVKPFPKPATPVVTAPRNPSFCEGESVTLSSTQADTYNWSGNQTTKDIVVNQSGVFSLFAVSTNGCRSDQSNTVTVTVHPLPAKPQVVASGSTSLCTGGSVNLTSSSGSGYSYVWSNGANQQTINVSTAGNYKVKVMDAFGCGSAESDAIAVVVNPRPDKPVIQVQGSPVFCADKNVTLQANSAETSFVWSSGEKTSSIVVTKAGTYSVQAMNIYNCLSVASDAVNTTVRALPQAPVIRALGNLEFCEGGTVTLASDNSALKHSWTSNTATQNSIVVSQSGTYTAQVMDELGCTSAASNAITVKADPLPTTPTITQVGTYKLQAGGTGTVFNWKRDNQALATEESVIKASASGTYTVQAALVYRLASGNNLTCFAKETASFRFVLDPNSQELSVYPIPAINGRVTVETLKGLKNVTIRLFTMAGKQVYEHKMASLEDTQTILVNENSGLLIMVVDADGFHASKRIVVHSY